MSYIDEQRELLQQFFTCYFHQDWADESETWEGQVDLYFELESAAEDASAMRRLVATIREYADLHKGDPLLDDKLVRDLGAEVRPAAAMGITAEEWLRRVAQRIEEKAPR
jgi:hypothetical protein